MPWVTPSLRQVRAIVRDDITAALSGALVVGNSVLRVMADANAGLAHLTMRYIDWLARQLMPDTAETEWLDRHGNIWLTNADGSVGRKVAAFATGTVNLTGTVGSIIPQGTRLDGAVEYETTAEVVLGSGETPASVIALSGGAIGNLGVGETLSVLGIVSGLDRTATVIDITGGTDEENDDDLRMRVLLRIRNPPMGGDAADYVNWTLAYSGVTRAWAAPLEQGMGTVTVRFLMDELRPPYGLPNADDLLAVAIWMDSVRPVAIKDFFVVAPILQFYDLTITGLDDDSPDVRARIEAALHLLDLRKSAPGQTMYRSWVSEAISSAIGESHHELTFVSQVMESNGHMPVLGTVTYGA